MRSSSIGAPQPLTAYARVIALVVVLLVFLAGIQLYVLSEQTDRYFAWTIAAPVTAAFLGAGYWSALVSILYGFRQRVWVNVRSTMPTAFTATTLLLIATFLHIDKFHLTSPVLITWLAAWVWIAVYVIVPPTLLVVFILQESGARRQSAKARQPTILDPRGAGITGCPGSPDWLRALLGPTSNNGAVAVAAYTPDCARYWLVDMCRGRYRRHHRLGE